MPALLFHRVRELLPGASGRDSDEDVAAPARRMDDRYRREERRVSMLDELSPLVESRRLLEVDHQEPARDLPTDDADSEARPEGLDNLLPGHAPGFEALPLADCGGLRPI